MNSSFPNNDTLPTTFSNNNTTFSPNGSFPTNSTIGAAIPLRKYINHIIFIVEGLFMIFGNLLVILTITLHKHLRRKEMYFLVGLAVGDGVYGVGIFYGGIKRLWVVLSRQTNLISQWACATYLQTPCYWFGAQGSALMMVALSIDRLIAINWFSHYRQLGKAYALKFLGAVFVHNIISVTVAYCSSFFLTARTSACSPVCVSPCATPHWYSMYHTLLPTAGGTLSVLLYVAVVIAYRKRSKMVMPKEKNGGDKENKATLNALKRQRSLTITLGTVTVFTFFCHMIPTLTISVLTVLGTKSPTFSLIAPYMWSVIMFNSLVNIFIYLWRMKEVRKGMWAILRLRLATEAPATGSRQTRQRSVKQAKTTNDYSEKE